MNQYDVRLKVRQDTEANWVLNDPILSLGEFAISYSLVDSDYTVESLKIGKGKKWSETDIYKSNSEIETYIFNKIGDTDTINMYYDTNDGLYKLDFVGTLSYNDLSNKPTLFSGSYSDLSNKPTIPTTTDGISEGSNKFWTNARTIGSTLTTYAKATTIAAISATDSILIALGKLEKKTDSLSTTEQRTGLSIAFDNGAGSYYGTPTSPESGSTISLAGSGNITGNCVTIFHQSSAIPTLPSGVTIKNGNYLNSSLNIFRLEYISSTYIICYIVQ